MNDNTKQPCIFCLEEKPLTIEHIFPDAIGGKLKIPCVCKDCNSKLGSFVDGKFQSFLHIQMSRQIHGLVGKKGHCPDVISGVWTADDSTSPIKRVKIVGDQIEVLPSYEITDESNGKRLEMVIPASFPYEKQSKMVETNIRNLLLDINPRLKDEPDKLAEKVKTYTDEALRHARHCSARPMLYKEALAWSGAGLQEYLKIAYELAFCLYGYPYVTKSNTARFLREAIFDVGDALKKIHYRLPMDIPKELDLFPDRELFFLIGDGVAFVRIFGLGGFVEVLDEGEWKDYLPIEKYLSKLLEDSPDVKRSHGRWLWGWKLGSGIPSAPADPPPSSSTAS